MLTNRFHVFIADDDEDDRYFFEKALKETGIPATVTQMANGIELLTLLKLNSKLPNIIFLDINMPLMDGLTALEQIRAVELYREIPIIIFSTSEDPISIRTAYERGAQLYLKKPAQYNDYILLLGTILSGKGETENVIKAFVRR